MYTYMGGGWSNPLGGRYLQIVCNADSTAERQVLALTLRILLLENKQRDFNNRQKHNFMKIII